LTINEVGMMDDPQEDLAKFGYKWIGDDDPQEDLAKFDYK
jgi:hypothetical protein